MSVDEPHPKTHTASTGACVVIQRSQPWRTDKQGMDHLYRDRVASAFQLTPRPRFNTDVLIDTTPMPDHIPKVNEIGASSAPLLSASFFIGARCRSFNDDYMQCKTEAYGRGELDCMREGRKVTRCAASVSVPPSLTQGKQRRGCLVKR